MKLEAVAADFRVLHTRSLLQIHVLYLCRTKSPSHISRLETFGNHSQDFDVRVGVRHIRESRIKLRQLTIRLHEIFSYVSM